nr:hypothetical protein [Tanacetum cinerariifolium]
ESTDDEAYNDVTQRDNVEKEKMDEDKANKEEEVDELYSDVNINLERRDTDMTDASLANSSSVSSVFISNMLNPNPDTSIDSILNLNTKSTSLADVPVTTNLEIPPSYVTTLPPPPIPLIQPQQQTLAPLLAIVPSTSLQNLPTFGSLFEFEDRVKSLEDDFSEFKQTNLFVETVSSILGIIDTYLANKMNEAVKIAVQLQSDRLRDEAQAKNEEFINKLDEDIKKIIKEQVKVQVKEQVTKILPRIEKLVNEQLKAKVLTRSSNEAKTSHAVKIIKEQVKVQVKEQVTKILPRIEKLVNEQLEAKVLTRSSNEAKISHAVVANLSELELKKILIDKIEHNKSIHRSDQQKTLYKALIDAYETDKVILDTYGDTVTIKISQDDEDDDKEPSAGSN